MKVSRVKGWLVLISLAMGLTLGACSNPCATVADKACASAGEASEECTRLRTVASRASTEERRSCEVALNLVESLEKVQ